MTKPERIETMARELFLSWYGRASCVAPKHRIGGDATYALHVAAIFENEAERRRLEAQTNEPMAEERAGNE